MAEAAVSFLLDNVKQLLLHQIHLIEGAKKEAERLKRDLELLKAYLVDSSRKKNKDEVFKVLMGQIREVIFEAEDIIDTFVIQKAEKKTQSYFLRMIKGTVKTLDIAKEIEGIRETIKDKNNILDNWNRSNLAAVQIGGASHSRKEDKKESFVKKDNIVGFEDEAETLIGYLMGKSKELDAISIIGMPGLGKTTLAWKIFHDPKIEHEIPTRIWVNVSQDYKRKDVFLSILRKFFTQIPDEVYHKSDEDIAQILQEKLGKGKFLIVMDDVWTAEAWVDLQVAFPRSNEQGKILITSRNEEVAKRANLNRAPHKLRLLTHKESWLLFQLEVFGNPTCPSELEELGKLIVDQCGRLPLAIVVIAGILVKKTSVEDENIRKNSWEKVCERVKFYLKDDPDQRMVKIISLSYDKLPYHLRPCFLYFAMFPEDFEIPVKKLTLMWIAEGFIQKKNEITLEEIAQDYLEELINRNLVMADKRNLDGSIKTCRIHDMLREFCKNEAEKEEEKLFQEVKKSKDGNFVPSTSEVENYRRLCIHSNVLSFISFKPYGPRVRTFFSTDEITLPPKNLSSIQAAFKLLRVLDVKSIKFSRFPTDLTHLVHLRYIALSSDFKVLPDLISKLWSMQTLIVDTTSRTLEINADIWNMINLRHFKTNASAILPKTPKGKEGRNKELQTLGTISTQNCTEDVFGRVGNLKKLGIRGLIATLRDAKGLEKLGNLEKLKLVNVLFGSPSETQLPCLPQPANFPPKLRRLTLSATNLEWGEHMNTLQRLNFLKVLKLKDHAFMGKSWNVADGGFRHLEVLHIERTDLVIWKASGQHFPKLGCLVLRNCEKLQAIPVGIHKSLHTLDLKRCMLAVDSARKIEKAKRQEQDQENGKLSVFKLYIAPGDE